MRQHFCSKKKHHFFQHNKRGDTAASPLFQLVKNQLFRLSFQYTSIFIAIVQDINSFVDNFIFL